MPVSKIAPRPTRLHLAGLLVLALALVAGAFQLGRQSVVASGLHVAAPDVTPAQVSASPERNAPHPNDYSKVTIRDIATVPFSELYDILRSASREQLAAWARDLAQMPRGPRQRAAVTAYYKSLVQVDYRAAIEIVFAAENLNVRAVAIDALVKAAPESIWSDLAAAIGSPDADLISNWSRVDPLAASEFIEKHPLTAQQRHPETGDDSRMVSLLMNWGEIDPTAAKNWLEADASRQTSGAFRALVTSWGRANPSGAGDYVIANAQRPNFGAAVNELVYQFVRSGKETATNLLLRLPFERAQAAVANVADITNPRVIDPNLGRPPDYQRPSDEVARWMIGLPVELWKESIGVVANKWLVEDSASARVWFDQLRTDVRDMAIAGCCRAAKDGNHADEEVIMLGLTITDQKLRDTELGELVRNFQVVSFGVMSATERINEFQIAEEQKAYLRDLTMKGANAR